MRHPNLELMLLALAAALACSKSDGVADPAGHAAGSGAGDAPSGVSGGSSSGVGGTTGAGGAGGSGASASGRGGSTGGASGQGGSSNAGTLGSGGGAGAPAGAAGGMAAAAGATSATGGAMTGSGGLAPGGAAGAGAGGDFWRPTAGLSWQWQLSESLGEPLDVDVYDIDWEVDASDVQRLHDRNISVICYVSVGSWEDFRPDAADFPAEVIGNDYDGWPGEKYVDIRADALRNVMLARFDVCQAKGFDAIEPDNMDVFELGADSGFSLTRADGIAYARWLADAAHARGLGIGQKNASSITSSIHGAYQWALTESCYSDGQWCGDVSAYLDEDKPVFMCEYASGSFADACTFGVPLHYSPILKTLDLDATVTSCP